MATKEVVRGCFDGLKARAIPKAVSQVALPEITWEDGTALNETEVKHLITILREEGPDSHSEVAPEVVSQLDPQSLAVWSKRVLDGWEEIESPPAQKWMLFQYRVTASDEAVDALCGAHDWTELASRKWAKANWYLSVIASRPATARSIQLFFDLLSEGKLDGTVQKSARTYLETFAQRAQASTQDYLESAGLIGVFPTRALPFVPGETIISTTGGDYIVGVNSGELSFTHVTTHKRSAQLPEGVSAQDEQQLAAWRKIVHEELLRWGGYLHYSMTLRRRFALGVIQGEWFAHPVARGVIGSLIWRTEEGQLVRIEADEVFDVNYDAVATSPDTMLELVRLDKLEPKAGEAWYEHLSDNEMLLPFDILQRDVYIEQLDRLFATKPPETEDHYDIINELYTYGYKAGLSDETGSVFENYKTFPEYNARVFFVHTGFEVVEGNRFSYPSDITGVRFQDLFGHDRSIEEVYISVLAEAVVDLNRLKHPSEKLMS